MISEYLKGDVIKYQLNSMFLIENYFVRNLNLLADLGGTFPCTPEALKLLIMAEIHIKITKKNFFCNQILFQASNYLLLAWKFTNELLKI